MVKWIVVMKIQPSICLDDWGKPRKNLSQVGRYRDLNPGPPEWVSRALPRSHLARSTIHCSYHCCSHTQWVRVLSRSGNFLFFFEFSRTVRQFSRKCSENNFYIYPRILFGHHCHSNHLHSSSDGGRVWPNSSK